MSHKRKIYAEIVLKYPSQSQPWLKFAIRAFSLKKRIWSSFSPERLDQWSVATRPPYDNSLSTLVELGGGVR